MIHRFLSLLIAVVLFSMQGFTQNLSWYKCLGGTLDQDSIVMHLHKAGNSYEGVYYYNTTQQPVSFTGNDTSVPGKIQLMAYVPDAEQYETFLVTVDQDNANGEWKKTPAAEALKFTATTIKDARLTSFDYIYTQGGSVLMPAWKASSAANFSAASIWPAGSNRKADFIKQVIRKTVDKKAVSEDVGALLLKEKKAFIRDYKKEYAGEPESNLKEHPYSYNMEVVKSITVVYQSPAILSLAYASYAYTGGAHGNHGTTYINLNLKAQSRLRLNTVVTPGAKPVLGKLLAKYFRLSHKLAPDASLKENGLFEASITPTDNFYLTGKGIGFVYTPYEIGPYAMGEIDIFIPYTELSKYLQPGFGQLIK